MPRHQAVGRTIAPSATRPDIEGRELKHSFDRPIPGVARLDRAMTYRDDRAALTQHLADLEARLAGIRGARASLTTLDLEEKTVVAELDTLR